MATMATMAERDPVEGKKQDNHGNDVIAGFRIGDPIRVSSKGSTYHGRRGSVVRFCKNRSTKWLYVSFDNEEGEKRLATSSIVVIENVPAKKIVVENSTRLMDDDTVETVVTVTSISHRILTAFEFVKAVREKHGASNKELEVELQELEKMILGLKIKSA